MRRRSFTLLELLVAMGILLALGTSLMLVLRGGLSTWRRGEARRESYDAAQAVLRQLREDLRSALPPHASPLGRLGEVEARLVADVDPDLQPGEPLRPRLFLVRSIKAESEHPVTGLAGSAIAADGVLDYRGDLEEARESRLRATGGAMEVAWVLGRDAVLWRGVRSPIGPPGSLFAEQDAYELALTAAEAASDPDRPALLRPFARDVIHLGLRFWSQYTTSWSLAHPCRRELFEREQSGPLEYWDSTRAMIAAPEGLKEREFATWVGAASLGDARDDMFPLKVMIELTLREHPAAGSSTFLLAPVSASDKELRVQDPGRLAPDGGWVLIEREWIEYSEVNGRSVTVTRRGGRGSVAAAHEAQSEVVFGRSFTTVVALPAAREDWGDVREPAR